MKNNYFMTTIPNIVENNDLRQPQIDAYAHAIEHFFIKQKSTPAVIVLPTGVGKTGLMGLLPYGISNGRVLIITPQLVIKDAIIDSLDPDYPENFWLKRKVFKKTSDLPVLIEYEGNYTKDKWLKEANIVVLNIHKLQQRLDSSLINRVDEDFFDMIIIDEAHHSTASTWVSAVNYFSKAKVIKLTGTPFRTDNEEIVGDRIFTYKLSSAMAEGYVKSLIDISYVPDTLLLTIDNDDRKYSVEEIISMKLKNHEWISRSVAYSIECSEKIVLESIKKLEEKISLSRDIPHKIIAVACSIEHAEQIADLYTRNGIKTAVIHSGLDKKIRKKVIKDIENHRVKVIVNVALLGEGYDHPYLSIAAIFRPFRNPLPYAQFIGRILRIIPEDNHKTKSSDNVGLIVSHHNLELEELFEFYKNEMQESETIKHIKKLENDKIIDLSEYSPNDTSTGEVEEKGVGLTTENVYLDTALIQKHNKEKEERKKKIENLKEMLKINEAKATQIVDSLDGDRTLLRRPDIYHRMMREKINFRIQQEAVPRIISKYHIIKENNDLSNSDLFNSSRYNWIKNKRNVDNAGMLAMYFNNALKEKIGYTRDKWSNKDCEIADDKLNEIIEYVEKVIEDFYNLD